MRFSFPRTLMISEYYKLRRPAPRAGVNPMQSVLVLSTTGGLALSPTASGRARPRCSTGGSCPKASANLARLHPLHGPGYQGSTSPRRHCSSLGCFASFGRWGGGASLEEVIPIFVPMQRYRSHGDLASRHLAEQRCARPVLSTMDSGDQGHATPWL